MTDDVQGGYHCPIQWCDASFVVDSLLLDHLATAHPEETP